MGGIIYIYIYELYNGGGDRTKPCGHFAFEQDCELSMKKKRGNKIDLPNQNFLFK
jgi:hypothetical protein